jgi:nucleoredoxin
MALRALLGVDNVKGKSGDVPVSSLEGKILMIYFSAHWCPPCRQFTPILAQFHGHLAGRANILFVSSDRDEGQFEEYYKEMPWLALPYAQRDTKAQLSKTFKVDGIPTLVVLDEKGNVLTRNGRGIVDSDPTAAELPWSHVNANIFDLLGSGPIATKDGKGLTAAQLKTPGSYFGVYFSAHWCPPCKAFTPKFAETYNNVVKAGKPFNCIFASWDREKAQFDEYYHEMPWATLPFDDPRIKKLSGRFEVESIPTLIIFDSNGNIVSEKARGAVANDPEGQDFPWAPKPMAKVAKMNPEDDIIEALNEKIIVLLNVNGASDATTAMEEFKAAGNAYTNPKVQFFYTGDTDFLDRVAGHLGITATVARSTVVAFNLPNNKAKDILSGEINQASIKAFVDRFVATQ